MAKFLGEIGEYLTIPTFLMALATVLVVDFFVDKQYVFIPDSNAA